MVNLPHSDIALEPEDDRRLLWTPPASYLQEQWFNSTECHLSNYNVLSAWKISGRLDRGALGHALGELTVRHEILRTGLGVRAGAVEQRVMRHEEPRLRYVDLRSAAFPETELLNLALSDAGRPFALWEPPLWHATLACVSADLHVLVVTMHHSICDGWSSLVMERDLISLYRASVTGTDPRLPEMPVQFGDYAAWERSFRDPALEAEWRDRLTSPPSRASIPFSNDSAFGQRPFEIISSPIPGASSATTERLLQVAREQHATLATVIYAAAVMTLAPAADGEIIFGIAHANRSRLEVQSLIGPLFDYLPLRVSLDGEPTFSELVRRIRDEGRSARDRVIPLRCIDDAVLGQRDGSGRGVFDVIVNFISSSGSVTVAGDDARGAGIRFAPYPIPNDWVRIRAERDFYGAGRLSYVIRRAPTGEIAGHLYGHGAALPWDRLSRLGRAFSTALARLGEDPQLRATDICPNERGLYAKHAEEE